MLSDFIRGHRVANEGRYADSSGGLCAGQLC